MPRPQAKASKKARAKQFLTYSQAGQLDPYEYLADKFMQAKSPAVKERLALELLPYERPKLRSVDVTQTASVNVTVSIGGDDDGDH